MCYSKIVIHNRYRCLVIYTKGIDEVLNIFLQIASAVFFNHTSYYYSLSIPKTNFRVTSVDTMNINIYI